MVAESLAQSRSLWHLREIIPLAQAEEGLNIKHDISLPVSAHRRVRARTPTTRCRPAFPGVRLVELRPPGRRQPALQRAGARWCRRRRRSCRAHEHAVNHLVYDAVGALGGSISAEHGVGALKRDELAQRKSPVALQMMRAIKQALDPHGRLNPGRVL